MALAQGTQLQIAFKRALGKVYTNPDVGVNPEPYSTTAQLSTTTVFAEPILATLSATSVDSNLYIQQASETSVRLVRFQLSDINFSNFEANADSETTGTTIDTTADPNFPDAYNTTAYKHAKALRLSGSFNESINTTGVYRATDITTQTAPFTSSYHVTGSSGRLQLVPPLFGSNYAATVRNSNGDVIDPSSINWVLDYYTGILFVQDDPIDLFNAGQLNGVSNAATYTPAFVDAYVYLGKFADEAIAEGGTGGGGTGTAVGWTKSGTVLFTSESYSQVQITGSLLVSGSDINLNVLGPITGSSILASSGFVGDGSQLTGIRKLSNGSTAIEALSDKLFASSSLVVSGSGIAFAVSGTIDMQYATFTSSLLPTDNQQQNLGSNSKQWNAVYAKTGSIGRVDADLFSATSGSFSRLNVTTLSTTTQETLFVSSSFIIVSSGSATQQDSNGLLVQRAANTADGLIFAKPTVAGQDIYGNVNRWGYSSSIALDSAQTSRNTNILPFMQIQTAAFTGNESPVLGKGDFLMVSGSGTTDGLYIYF
jgi:hypothetical protein